LNTSLAPGSGFTAGTVPSVGGGLIGSGAGVTGNTGNTGLIGSGRMPMPTPIPLDQVPAVQWAQKQQIKPRGT
jgi:hypothetical protein